MSRFQLVRRYLSYLIRSKSRHGIHSPFLYELIEKVFKGPSKGIDDLEVIRERLLKSKVTIPSFDLGAGSTYKVRDRTLSDITRQSASSSAQCMLLNRLAMHLQVKKALEFGSSVGISAAYIAETGAQVISLEGNPALHQVAIDNFADRRNNLDYRCGAFEDLLPHVLEEEGPFDLIFIDGNHRKEPTVDYFKSCLPFVHERSAIIFDDIHWSTGMEQAWTEIAEHEMVTLSVDLFWCGMVFFDVGLSRERFTVRY